MPFFTVFFTRFGCKGENSDMIQGEILAPAAELKKERQNGKICAEKNPSDVLHALRYCYDLLYAYQDSSERAADRR